MNPFFDKYYGIRSKNAGPFLAFGEAWFTKYQDWLLFFLNAPILKYWSRLVFRINRDCKYSDPIIQIEPNNYKVLLSDGQIRGDFRTHPKFSKRVYFAFRWWWWCLHYIDEWFKVPKLSFGFDSLTAYPDPDPETSTWDGCVYRGSVDETLTVIRAGAGTGGTSTRTDDIIGAARNLRASTTAGQFQFLARNVYLFSTSTIGAGSVISAATLSLYPSSVTNAIGSPDFHITSVNPTSDTGHTNSDYGTFGSTSFASLTYANFGTGAYRDFSFNADGIASVAKTGISKYGRRTDWDLNDNYTGIWASGQGSGVMCYASDDTSDPTKDPKLVITYSSSSIKTISGVAIASVKTASGLAKASIKKIVGLA